MKLGKLALVEIVDIVREGLLEGKDISERLRQLDLAVVHGIPQVEGGTNPEVGTLTLTDEYIRAHQRADKWDDN
jgi:hypothetical protein